MATKKEHILITVTNDLSYDQRMIKTANTLVDLGYSVELIGRKKKNSIPLKDASYKQKRLNCIFEKGKLFYLEYNIRLYFYLNSQSFQRIIAVDLDTIIPAYYAAKKQNAITYYDAHEYFPEMPEVVRRPLVQRLWQWVERTYVPRFHCAYTVSAGIQNILKNAYDKKVSLIRNVPKRAHYARTAATAPFILYQGALNEGRGLENMILAMKHLNNIQLKLAGEGDLSVFLRKFTEENCLSDRVIFLGNLEPDVLKNYTNQAFIGINLLENRGLNYYFSLANKFFDYIQAGVPSINMNFPEYSAINNEYDCCLLINSLAEAEITAAIQSLTQDKQRYDSLAENCKKAAAALNWENESIVFKTELNF
jgi:glycosyltransferase involved in cell wall biosynthesis